MRINVFVAQATGLSRRGADKAITKGKVSVNSQTATIGQTITDQDTITFDGRVLHGLETKTLIAINKPVGFVVSRQGQGTKTVYDLLPRELAKLKPIGRLDKNSSGLLLLTDDGKLAHNLTHPSAKKNKVYLVGLNLALKDEQKNQLINGVELEDGLSKLAISKLSQDRKNMTITIHEGRNRQIRRSFESLGYTVIRLHRIKFGDYELNGLKTGDYIKITDKIMH